MANSAKALKFSTVLKEQEVILVNEKDEEKEYFIRELTGEQRQAYNDQFDVKVGLDENNKPTMGVGDNFKMWSSLDFVSRCLYAKDSKKPVGTDFIKALPGSILKDLGDAAKELSGLDNKALLKAKNDLEASDSNGIV